MEDITGVDQQLHELILVHIPSWLLEIFNLAFRVASGRGILCNAWLRMRHAPRVQNSVMFSKDLLQMAIRIKARGSESVEQMLRRFKKLCEKEGLTKEVKKRQYYEKPSERRRRDDRKSAARVARVDT